MNRRIWHVGQQPLDPKEDARGLNPSTMHRRVEFVKSQVTTSSKTSIVEGHAAADQHFTDS
jgi:hypothetical protein